MDRTTKTFGATRSDAERGRLISRLLTGAWRAGSPAPDFSEAELAEIAPLLCQTGSAALGWWRVSSPTVREGQVRLHSTSAGRAEPSLTVGVLTPAEMLHEAYRQFRLSALIHEQEIKYVFSLLRAERIEPVLVKGWAIARLYPDRGLRPYGDIDLCVRPDQFAKAERALKCLESLDGHYVDLHSGFAKLELATRFSARSQRPLRLSGKPGCQETHRRDAEGAEVSQKAFSRQQAFRVLTSVGSCVTEPRAVATGRWLFKRHAPGEQAGRYRSQFCNSPTEVGTLNRALWDELFERSQLVSLGEEKIRVLCGEDHLRILCLHLLRSGAWRPLWLCDVAVALESRGEDFDWDRCLGRNPKIADWVACTIGVAQELLGAEDRCRRSEVRGQKSEIRGPRAEVRDQRSGASPFALCPLPLALSRPGWLAPAILRQWGRSLNPHAIEAALPALSAQMRDARKFFKEIYARWDQPVRATVAVRGRFNNWPRLPYQLTELLLHSSEVPKQLALMFRGRLAAMPPVSAVRLSLTGS